MCSLHKGSPCLDAPAYALAGCGGKASYTTMVTSLVTFYRPCVSAKDPKGGHSKTHNSAERVVRTVLPKEKRSDATTNPGCISIWWRMPDE